jgi:rhodanese-related sulfurtransferase
MKKVKNLLFVLMLGVCFLNCSEATSQVNSLNLDDFVSKIKATPNAQLIDVRSPGEWAQGKITSSNLISVADSKFLEQASKLDKTKPIFVYCAVGGRSSKASGILQKAGFTKVYNLNGAGYTDLAAKGIK